MKVYTIINPLFKDLEEVHDSWGITYVKKNFKKKQEELKKQPPVEFDIVDILYSLPDIEIDWM